MTSLFMAIGMPGPLEIGLILLGCVLLFGASRIPQMGEALGKGIRNFKKSVGGEEIDVTPKQQESIDESSAGGSADQGESSKKSAHNA